MKKSQDYPSFKDFEKYVLDNGISLDNEDDWRPWWKCWQDGFGNGIIAGVKDTLNAVVESIKQNG